MPHWNMEYQVLYEDCRKSLEVKSEEKNIVCRVSKNDTRQITTLPSVRTYGTRQRILKKNKKSPLCRVPVRVALGKEFKKIKKNTLPNARSEALGKEVFLEKEKKKIKKKLYRVLRSRTLGKPCFTECQI